MNTNTELTVEDVYRFLRNNLGDDDYAAYSGAIEALEAQLAAARETETKYDEALCTVAAQRDAYKDQLAAAQGVPEGMRLDMLRTVKALQAEEDAGWSQDARKHLRRLATSIGMLAAPIPQQVAEPAPTEPDMFWNHDDAEKLYFSIDEFLNDEICNGTPLEVGDTRTIQCALRLPNIEIRITAVHDEDCEADYEVIAAAPQPKDMK